MNSSPPKVEPPDARGKPAYEQHVAVELAPRNLEEECVSKLMRLEKAGARARRFVTTLSYGLRPAWESAFAMLSAQLRGRPHRCRWRIPPDDEAALCAYEKRRREGAYEGEGFSFPPSMLTAMPME